MQKMVVPVTKSTKSKKKNKTKALMLGQTEKSRIQASYNIEDLMKNKMAATISFYINKYGPNIERRLGLTKDDLLSHAREQIWKGLLTYNPNGGANLKTYLNNLLANRFNTLLDRSSKKKYNMVDYYADVWATPGIDPEQIESEETPETIFEARETLMQLTYQLTGLELQIHGDLMFGRSMAEMETRHKVSRPEIAAAILKIVKLRKTESSGHA